MPDGRDNQPSATRGRRCSRCPKPADLTSVPPVVRDFSDVRVFQNTPKWTGSFSFTYTADLGERGRLTFTPAASYRSSFNMFEIPSTLGQSSYWLLDASLVWTEFRRALRQLCERLLRPAAYGAAVARSEVLGRWMRPALSRAGHFRLCVRS